ncbi:MAG TPA: ABC transporter substrate-binding protein [Acidiferrobacterales bacterium]|nr:ABC transporter substrate-binding protein [Acidiferrobacterales bacterium]
MKRIKLSLAGILIAGLWLASVGADAGSGKVPRIGYLTLSPLLEPPSPERAGFLKGLREHGYEDGKNIIIEYRSAEGDPEALPFVAEALVASGVRLVVTAGYPAIKAVQDASDAVPIVLLFAADPDATGFAKSLARPGGNITGMSMQNRELGAKRLELLKEAVPDIRRVAVLWDSSNPVLKPEWESTQMAGRRLGIQFISADGANEPNFEKAFALIVKARPDALVTFVDLRLASYRQIIPEFAIKQRLPTMFALTAFVESGGFMSYAPDFEDLSRRSAGYVDKILKGANPAELPIQQPTHYKLVVNLKTAKMLGLKLPERILQRADKVIE